MITQLGNVTVTVRDLDDALSFYNGVLGLRVAFYDKKHRWLCFDTGRTTLSLTTPWNARAKKLIGVQTGVSFNVVDLRKTYTRLKKRGVKFLLPPRKEPWGGRLANFEDPDGNQYFLLQMPKDFGK